MIEAETLARGMAERMRARRLRRIGELSPEEQLDGWENLSAEEKRNWIDAAETAMEVIGEMRRAEHPTEATDHVALLREDLAGHFAGLDSIYTRMLNELESIGASLKAIASKGSSYGN